MDKKENKQYSLSLDSIQEMSFFYNKDYDYSKLNGDNFDFSLSHVIHVDSEKNIFGLQIGINYKTNTPEQELLVEYSMLVKFKIPELSSLVIEKGEKVGVKDKNLMINVFNISVGVLRGAFFLKTMATPLEKFPLPIISTKIIEKTLSPGEKK